VADGLFQVNADGQFVAANDAFLDVAGEPRADLLGEPLERVFPSAVAERLSAARRGLAGSEPDAMTLSVSLPTDDGERSHEIWLRLLDGADGDAAGSIRPADPGRADRATTEEYDDTLDRTEARLHEETEMFRSLVDAVEEYAIFMLDPDGKITSWNEGATRIKGYDAEEVLGEHISLFYTDEDAEAGVPEANLEAAETGPVEDEGWRVRADGSQFWANVTITPVADEDGDLRGYAKVTRDMTERKRARDEHQLQLSVSRSIAEAASLENGLQSALEAVCEWMDWEVGQAWVPTGDGSVERLPVSYVESTEYAPFDETSSEFTFGPGEGIPGRVLRSGESVWFPDVSAVSEDVYPRTALAAEVGVKAGLGVPVLVDGEVAVVLEFYMSEPRRKNDWLIEVTTSIATELGSLVARKKAEDALEHERDLVEQILEANPVGIAVIDAEGELTRLNESGAEILGVDAEETDATDFDPDDWTVYDEDGDRVPPAEWPQSRALRTGESIHDWRCEVERADGTGRWISANAVPLFDEAGAVERVILTANDISTLKRREADLRHERDLVETVIEVSPDMIGVFDADDGGLLRSTARAEEFLGLKERPLLGASENPPDEYEYVGGEVLLYDEDGRPVPPEEHPFARAIETGEPVYDWQGQMENADGERRWFSINAMPIYEDGHVERVVAVGDDITQLKEQDRALARERDDLAAELDEMFRRIDDAFYAVDDQFRFTYVNERAEELLDRDEAQLLGESVWEVFPEATETPAWESFHRALETQEPTSYEVYFDPLEFWVKANVYPSETGLSVYFEDVSERKEREQQLEQYRAVAQASSDAIVVIDEESTVVSANPAVAEILGYEPADLVGEPIMTLMSESTAEAHREALARYLETGEKTINWDNVELPSRHRDGHEVPIAVSINEFEHVGDRYFAGVIRDITERKERERQLERYETVVETVNDGIYVVDQNGRYTMVNEEYASMVGYDTEELVGQHVTEVVDEEVARRARELEAEMLSGERESASVEAELETPDGETVVAEATFAILPSDDGDYERISDVRDVTERKERERELRTRVSQQEAVTDLGQQALEERDLDALFDDVTDCVAGVLDADYCKVLELLPDGEEVLLRSGVGWQDGLVGEATVGTGLDSQAGYTLRTEEPVVVDDLATEIRFSGPDLLVDHDVTSGISVVIGPVDDPWGVLGVHTTAGRDFSEHDVNFVQSVGTILATAIQRAERERDLELYETIVETIWDGVYALDPEDNFELVNEAFASMLDYDRDELLGQPASIVHSEEVSATARQMTDEVAAGERESATMELELRKADGDAIPTETQFGPYPYDEERYGRTGVSRDVTERLERQRALERQREELAALNRLNQVVGEITHAAVESSSREEIERLVCERLVDSESYLFAWIGETDRTSGTIEMRAEAGVEGYLDDVTLAVEREDGVVGPTGRAIRTEELQITQDIETDSDYESWRKHALEYGFRSSAAIPITYENVLYGVLNVYSERVGAFDGYERTLLSRLGNVVGHTINALERKEALMSDQVVEVEVEIPDVVSYADEPVPTDGTITFDRTVPVGGDAYLEYGTVDEAGLAVLEGLVASIPFWEEVSILDDRFGEISFELRLSEPPAISTVAAYGGRVQEATIEDGDYRMTVELPPTADVRAVVEALQAEYPEMQLAAQRRTTRKTWSAGRIDAVLDERLTDRQRASLEAAYYAGYFDTPRKRSGEEVAESLGITAPTLHQHLRKGQRKLLAAVLDGPGQMDKI
jgi:PAS domain S-box-containing protein